MAPWLIPALRQSSMLAPSLRPPSPVFTKKRPDAPVDQTALLQQQVGELQSAVSQNAANIKEAGRSTSKHRCGT